MGRELRRKESKKNKKNIDNNDIELDIKISLITLLKLVFFIILLLLVIYYIIAVFVTKEIDISNKNANTTEETSNTTNSISDKILASNIFNQTESTYYVYFYDFGTNQEDDLSNLISSNIDDKLYKVDTKSGLNSKYVTDKTGNKNAKDIDSLKVISNTLIKIENDQIVGYFEGKNAIMSGIKG